MNYRSLLPLTLAILLTSCGLFDDDSNNNNGSTDQGRGTLKLDGDTWDFRIFACTIRPNGSFSLTGGPFDDQEPHFEIHLQNRLKTDDSPAFSQLTFASGRAEQGGYEYLYGSDPDEAENMSSYFQLNGKTITANPPMLRMRRPGYELTPGEDFVEVESSLEATCLKPSTGLLSPN